MLWSFRGTLTKLFNRAVCWNDEFDYIVPLQILDYSQRGIKYSSHYSEVICDRGIGSFISADRLMSGVVVEVELEDGNITKAVIRNDFNDKDDLITVVRFLPDGLLFVTSWLNRKSNNHEMLDTTRYELFL